MKKNHKASFSKTGQLMYMINNTYEKMS
jgi:hypothetical protein